MYSTHLQTCMICFLLDAPLQEWGMWSWWGDYQITQLTLNPLIGSLGADSAGLGQIRFIRQSHSSLAPLRCWFRCIFDSEVSLLICRLRFMPLPQIMRNYHLTWLLRSPLANYKAPYVVLFDLRPLIEDGNLQVYKYCVHTGIGRNASCAVGDFA